MTRATSSRTKTLTLAAVLDFASIQSLKETLSAAAEKSSSIRLSGYKVQRVTTPAIQVLLSAAKTAAAGGGQFRIIRPSPALSQAFDDLGLGNEFEA